MINTIFIMPNKGTESTATMMIVVDEKEPSTDPKTYQYVYVGNINDLPSDVLTEGNIVNIPGTNLKSVMSQKGTTDLISEYNVSTNNNNAEYTFAQAVALVPSSLQKGGLTIKYIDSTTHEYVIKRLMSSAWNITESNWQGVDDVPTFDSRNLVESGGVKKPLSDLNKEINRNNDVLFSDTGVLNNSQTVLTANDVLVGDTISIDIKITDTGSNKKRPFFINFYDSENNVIKTVGKTAVGDVMEFSDTFTVTSNFRNAKCTNAFHLNANVEITSGVGIKSRVSDLEDEVAELQNIVDNNTNSIETLSEEIDLLDNGSIKTYILSDAKTDTYTTLTGWTLSEDKYTCTSSGSENKILINKEFYCTKRTVVAEFNYQSVAKVYVGFISDVNPRQLQQSLVSVDFSLNTLNLHTAPSTESPVSTIIESEEFTPTSNSSVYRLEISFPEERGSIKCTLFDAFGKQIATINKGFQSNIPSWGLCFDKPYMFTDTIGLVVNQFKVTADYNESIYMQIIGDSITQGYNATFGNDYATLIESLYGNGMVVKSGRSGGTIDNVFDILASESPVFSPKYIMITVGSNGNPNATELRGLKTLCDSMGSILILNHVPLQRDTDKSTLNTRIDTVTANYGIKYCVKFDVALALNHNITDGWNSAMYSDGVHPKDVGHQAMYEQFLVDFYNIVDEVNVRRDTVDISALYPNDGENGGNTYTFGNAVSKTPAVYREPGTTIRYIDSISHKYVSATSNTSSWSTNEHDWLFTNTDIRDDGSNIITGENLQSFVGIPTFEYGYYINSSTNSKTQNVAQKVSKPVYLTAKQKVTIYSSNSSGVVILSYTDKNESYYEPIVKGSGEFDGTILVPKTGYYVISIKNDGTCSISDKNRSVTDFMLSCMDNRLANPLYETREHYNAEHSDAQIAEEIALNHSLITSGSGRQYRIPVNIITNTGTSLVAAERRINGISTGDGGDYSIDVARKAIDGTWSQSTVIPFTDRETGYGHCMNPVFVIDRTGVHGVEGRIYLFCATFKLAEIVWHQTTESVDIKYVYSDDDGVTWSEIHSIKTEYPWDTTKYKFVIPAANNGIQITNGNLIVPCMCYTVDNKGRSMFIYTSGGWMYSSDIPFNGIDECCVVETTANQIVLSARNNQNYIDNIDSWGDRTFEYVWNLGRWNEIGNSFIQNRSCKFDITKMQVDGTNVYIKAAIDSNTTTRDNITIWASLDLDKWIRVYRVYAPSGNGYPSVCVYNNRIIVCYEMGADIGYQEITPLWNLIGQSAINYININISFQDRLQMMFNALKGLI